MMIFRLWQNALLDKVQAPDLFFLAFDASAWCAAACTLSQDVGDSHKHRVRGEHLKLLLFSEIEHRHLFWQRWGKKQSSVAVMHILADEKT